MDQPVSYDEDFLAWSEQQAAVLRGLARSRRSLPNELDLERLAEEIEDAGRSELNAAKSYIRQILAHLIKTASEPATGLASHWRKEIVAFHSAFSTRSRRPWSRSPISICCGVVQSRRLRRHWKTRAGHS